MVSRRNIIKSFLAAPLTGIVTGYPYGIGITPEGPGNYYEPGYLKLHKSGELRNRGEILWAEMEHCLLCPRMCGVNRLKKERGFCGSDARLEISAFHPHFGEEKALVGSGGSGTIFLTNCSLRCAFCINWETSQGKDGNRKSIDQLAEMMIALQKTGCTNINVVTPTHYSPHIVLAADKAASKGLRIPLVYNTCGWERVEILRVLEGIVDIYLPDFKYADSMYALKFSAGAATYPEATKRALLEMHRQVGIAEPASDGIIYRGLMIRHLVMPNNVSGTREVVEWIAANLPKETFLNIMSQYTPMFKASEYPEISRRITRLEYNQAIGYAIAAGLTNIEIQGFSR